MKKLLSLSLLSIVSSTLLASPVIYEGFNPTAGEQERVGWLTSWHRLAGDVAAVPNSIGIAGLPGSAGALMLTAKGEALAQISADVDGTYYGAFRFRIADIKNDSVIGLLIAAPDLAELTPQTAHLSLLVKGWRNETGSIRSGGQKAQTVEGIALEAGEAYQVIFKVENEPSARSVSMWIMNEKQTRHFVGRTVDEAVLNSAELSGNDGAIVQRLHFKPRKTVKLNLSKGDVIACVAKFSAKTIFDEIRISTLSLEDALGVPAK
jgi:hypothetical protein